MRFDLFCQRLFILTGNINDFLQMLLQMLQPFILIKLFHMCPAAMQKRLYITCLLKLLDLLFDLFLNHRLCILSKCPDKFLYSVIRTLSGSAAFCIIDTAFERIWSADAHILERNVDRASDMSLFDQVAKPQLAELLVQSCNVFRDVKPDILLLQRLTEDIQPIRSSDINASDPACIQNDCFCLLCNMILDILSEHLYVGKKQIAAEPVDQNA